MNDYGASRDPATQEWQTIETVPHTGMAVMVWVNADGIVGPHCFAPVSVTTEGWWWDDSTGDRIDPIQNATHWMPLPAKPELRAAANPKDTK